jgi:hypothetical protein
VIFETENKNINFSTHAPPTLIHLSHRFTCASNPQHSSLLTVVSATSAPGRASSEPLNKRMRVCYLDCHEAGLCRCLVIHIETLLRPLQLFYFHLWPIYWLSLVSLRSLMMFLIHFPPGFISIYLYKHLVLIGNSLVTSGVVYSWACASYINMGKN